VDYLIRENADVFAICKFLSTIFHLFFFSAKSGQNALSEAARKNRPLITSLLQDALQTPSAASSLRDDKSSEDFSVVGTTNSDIDYLRFHHFI
jgi:hypothetical protein